jgi:hypothetical protein
METTKKKWVTLLLTATMSFALLFGATACNDNNDGNGNVIVEDEAPDVVVPDNDTDVVVPDVDVDVDNEAPAETPAESPAAS